MSLAFRRLERLRCIKSKYLFLIFSLLVTLPTISKADSTYIFFRHGEKPKGNSGQLTCQGLNRALNLPSVLLSRYGRPDMLYAAAPKEGSIRPLATIMPIAVHVSEPVIIQYDADQPRQLSSALLKENKAPLTFISWERNNLVLAVRRLVGKTGGDAAEVPYWPPSDFDSIFEVVLDNNMKFKSFKHVHEGLNQLSLICPQPH